MEQHSSPVASSYCRFCFYPILGIKYRRRPLLEQKPRLVVLVGAEYLPRSPALLNSSGDGFNPALFDTPVEAERLVVLPETASAPATTVKK